MRAIAVFQGNLKGSANGQRLSVGARNYDFWIGLVRVYDLK